MSAYSAVDRPALSADDEWLEFLQGQNLIEGVGPESAPYKVIKINQAIHDWPLRPSQRTLPGMSAPNPVETILSPGNYLQRLRMIHSAARRARVAAGEFSVPAVLSRLADEVEASRALLELRDDWDGEGSPGYERATWIRATRFLCVNADRIWQHSGDIVPAPDISPGSRGSIDLHWRTSDRELLINFPAHEDLPVRFYGDDGAKGSSIEGEFDADDSNSWLLMWLIRR